MSDRITEIENRLNAATPGPWEATHRPKLPNENDPDILAARRDELGGEPGSSIWANEEQLWGSLWPSRNGSADAEFIAHSPSDVAYLLAELRKRDDALARVEAVAARLRWEADNANEGAKYAAEVNQGASVSSALL